MGVTGGWAWRRAHDEMSTGCNKDWWITKLYLWINNTLCFVFKDFIHQRHRGRNTGWGRSRLHAGSPTWDSIPGPWIMTWAKGRRSTTEPPRLLSHTLHCFHLFPQEAPATWMTQTPCPFQPLIVFHCCSLSLGCSFFHFLLLKSYPFIMAQLKYCSFLKN